VKKVNRPGSALGS